MVTFQLLTILFLLIGFMVWVIWYESKANARAAVKHDIAKKVIKNVQKKSEIDNAVDNLDHDDIDDLMRKSNSIR